MTTAITGDSKYCRPNVANKVVYELNMFTFLYAPLHQAFVQSATFIPGDITYLGTGLSDNENDLTTFALLESLLLHTRVLREFFYSSVRDGDNVMASDFVPNWDAIRPPEPEYLVERKPRLNKAIAHLSLKRIHYDANEKQWNVDAIRNAIVEAKEAFVANLPAARKPWFSLVK